MSVQRDSVLIVVKNNETELRVAPTDAEINLGYAKQDYLDHIASKNDWRKAEATAGKDELFEARTAARTDWNEAGAVNRN